MEQANDWKALRVADVGLSLSEAEASIAAPFTSNIQNISSAVDLLLLGRFSLDISYWLLKFMIINTTIELSSVIILYFNTLTISDNQYIWIDLLWIMPVTIFLWMIDPKPDLSSYYPSNTLLNPRIICSIIGQVLITALSIIGLYFWLKGQGFYIAADKNSEIKSGKVLFIKKSLLYKWIKKYSK